MGLEYYFIDINSIVIHELIIISPRHYTILEYQ